MAERSGTGCSLDTWIVRWTRASRTTSSTCWGMWISARLPATMALAVARLTTRSGAGATMPSWVSPRPPPGPDGRLPSRVLPPLRHRRRSRLRNLRTRRPPGCCPSRRGGVRGGGNRRLRGDRGGRREFRGARDRGGAVVWPSSLPARAGGEPCAVCAGAAGDRAGRGARVFAVSPACGYRHSGGNLVGGGGELDPGGVDGAGEPDVRGRRGTDVPPRCARAAVDAIESLASVGTLCIDKTGTLTEAALRVVEVLPAGGEDEQAVRRALGAAAAGASTRNLTLQAIADACPAESQEPVDEIPFSSRRRWSAVELPGQTYYLGAPGRIPVGDLESAAQQRQGQGRRVVALARSAEPCRQSPVSCRPPAWSRSASSFSPRSFGRGCRTRSRSSSARRSRSRCYPATRHGRSPRSRKTWASRLPASARGTPSPDPQARWKFAEEATVVGRISPEGKQHIVRALTEGGRYVAMVGDGVNDVRR